MKKLFLASLFFLFIFRVECQEMKVMTFNIRFDNPSDSIYSWNGRKEKVFRMLKKEKPDFAGMQEVLKNQADDLLKKFPGYAMTGVGRDDGKEKGEYSAIFYNRSRFELLKGSTFWLSQQPQVPGSRSWDAACTRIVSWGQFRERATGKTFFFFNTHFDHISAVAREKSAEMLIRAADSIAGSSICIITGDFNETRNSKMYQILVSAFKDAADLQVPTAVLPDYTFIGFPFHPEKGNAIDMIFLKNFGHAEVHDYRAVPYNENGLYPSDHLPVVTVIDLKN